MPQPSSAGSVAATAQRHRDRPVAEAALVTVLYGLATLAITWPLFADPASTILDANQRWLAGWFQPGFAPVIGRDVELLVWLLAWDTHALTNGLPLFDANIFFPTPEALAYSEHALGHLPIAGPAQVLSGNAVLAHQVNLFVAFPLTGLATWLLLRHFGVRRPAAFIAGFVLAFAPARLDMMYHAHLLAAQYLVLALLFLDRVGLGGRLLDALALCVTTLLGILCSYYVAYMTACGLLASAVASWIAPRDRPRMRGIVAIATAMGVAGAIFVGVSRPYIRLQRAGAIEDHTTAAAGLQLLSNAPLANWFFPPALLRGDVLHLDRGSYAYLGCTALLVLLALLPGGTDPARRRARRIGGAVFLTGWVLALGPSLNIFDHEVSLPYRWAMEVVPGFSSMRVPGRFCLLAMVGWAILVGLGCDRLLAYLERERRAVMRMLAPALILAIIVLDWDLARSGFAATPAIASESDAAVAERLAVLPPGPVLEIPFDGDVAGGAGRYMLLSTIHWKPLLNGSSGYVPFSSQVVRDVVRMLPARPALDLLVRMTGVRYLVVHVRDLTPLQLRIWSSARGIELLETFGESLLFRVTVRHPPDRIPALAACSRDEAACESLRSEVAGLLAPP